MKIYEGDILRATKKSVLSNVTSDSSLRWKRDGEIIDGATGSDYTITGYDIGKVITLEQVEETDAGVEVATSVQYTVQSLSDYAAGGVEPHLVADFDSEYYRSARTDTTFSELITHARAGNATMTDGYGPELVVNGGFDNDVSGWNVAGTSCTLSYDNGRAKTVCTGTDGNSRIGRSVGTLTAGTAYIFTLQYNEATSYGFIRVTSGSITSSSIQQEANTTNNGNRRLTMVFIPTTTQEYFVIAGGNFVTNSVSTFDNISVRELPAIKWAPHNLLRYSEDFSNSYWTKQTGTTVTANQAVAPDGSSTADLVVGNGTDGIYRSGITVPSNGNNTKAVWLKGVSGGESVKLKDPVATVGTTTCNLSTEWQLFKLTETQIGGTAGLWVDDIPAGGIYIWGAHLYSSDLGGMVDNPDQPSSRASYVPTTSSAVYLPRRNHHVYNGSVWVNEGVLAESEARTNLATYSNSSANWGNTETSVSTQSSSPTGLSDAILSVPSTNTALHYHAVACATPTANSAHTASVFAKASGYSHIALEVLGFNGSYVGSAKFDLNDEVATLGGRVSGIANLSTTIQSAGNGWYRCSISCTMDSNNSPTSTPRLNIIIDDDGVFANWAGDGTSGVLLYGAQLEEGSTPSSYIPTNGATATRPAETFTIPAANLPWPTPQVIGNELVTNGTFDTDVSGWTVGANGSLSVSSNRLRITNVSGRGNAYTSFATEVGKVYSISLDVPDSDNQLSAFWVFSGSAPENYANFSVFNQPTGSHEYFFVASSTTTYLTIYVSNNSIASYTEFDNVSVREINPLSVSIQMDGRMTYADENNYFTLTFYRWYADGDNYLSHRIDTALTQTGHQVAQQRVNAVDDYSTGNPSNIMFSPGALVPFNVAARHGTTVIQVASDGLKPAPNTTPTALPDLSSTDLSLGYDYMGTVRNFKVWSRDIGDSGLVEATNPSLEPSLSLTFDSTDLSYIDLEWSE